jgi:hypothetical protein
MQDAGKRQMESVVLLRKRLAEVEAKRTQHEKNVPAKVWQEFAEVSHSLEQAEDKVQQTCREITADVYQVKITIMSTREEYNRWREQTRAGKISLRQGVAAPVVERVLGQMQAANVLALSRLHYRQPDKVEKETSDSIDRIRAYASLLGEERGGNGSPPHRGTFLIHENQPGSSQTIGGGGSRLHPRRKEA